MQVFGVWDSRPQNKRTLRPGLLCNMEGVPRLFRTEAMAQTSIDLFIASTGDDPKHYRVVPVNVEAAHDPR